MVCNSCIFFTDFILMIMLLKLSTIAFKDTALLFHEGNLHEAEA